MHKVRFSIVMPAYNAQNTIEKAINSIRSQSFNNWQLVVVDDGSQDDTFAIASRFALKDRRILVIRQNNKGVSAARNTALNKCIGEYVLFIDSDDYFLFNAFDAFNQALNRKPSDVAIAHYCIFNQATKKYTTFQDCTLDKHKFDDPQQVIKQMREKNITPAVFRFAVKRSLILGKDLLFDTSLYAGEDTLFIGKLVCNAKDFVYVQKVVYQYNVSVNSLSRSKNSQWVNSLLLSCQKLYAYSIIQTDEKRRFLYNYICININFLLQSYSCFNKEVKVMVKKWVEDNKIILQKALTQQPVLMGMCKTLGLFNGMLMGAKIVKVKISVISR